MQHPTRRPAALRVVALVAAALVAGGCSSILPHTEDECRPVDVGGECFPPSRQGFLDHALESTGAWPQLDGLPVEADLVIAGFDRAAGQPTWIVPIRANGRVVAASRFLPFADEVRLGEIALYLPARANFPIPGAGERLVLVPRRCGDPLPEACVFVEHGWRLEPAP